MNRHLLAVLLAVATVCTVPSISCADPWTDIGPASAAFNYNGYIDPWTGRPGNGAYSGGFSFSNTQYRYVPTWRTPLYPQPAYAYPQPFAYPSPVTTEASIQVQVPANAEIWFDNRKTSQTGELRTFVSPSLENGKTFTYAVRARWTDASGKVVEQTKQVEVQAGQLSTADFRAEVARGR
jgi:uncharacterized protein (TIGR03000 family)